MRFHGTNVGSCEVITSGKRILLNSAYPTPSTLEHLPDLEEALAHLWYQDPIVLGELNAKISLYQNPRSKKVAGILMEFGLMDLFYQFRKR